MSGDYYTVKQVAQILDVPKIWVYMMVNDEDFEMVDGLIVKQSVKNHIENWLTNAKNCAKRLKEFEDATRNQEV